MNQPEIISAGTLLRVDKGEVVVEDFFLKEMAEKYLKRVNKHHQLLTFSVDADHPIFKFLFDSEDGHVLRGLRIELGVPEYQGRGQLLGVSAVHDVEGKRVRQFEVEASGSSSR